MSPEQFRNDVRTAYEKAIANTNSQADYVDETRRLFEDITIFGKDAGVDLAQTLLSSILQEAVHAAAAKKQAIMLRPGKIGLAALTALVDTLGELTGLPVTYDKGFITITWATDEPSR